MERLGDQDVEELYGLPGEATDDEIRALAQEVQERRAAERQPATVQCNACGKTWSREAEIWEAQEVNAFRALGGYGNRQWGDETLVEWAACQDCLAAWFRTFQISPSVSDYEIYPFGHARQGPRSPLKLREVEEAAEARLDRIEEVR